MKKNKAFTLLISLSLILTANTAFSEKEGHNGHHEEDHRGKHSEHENEGAENSKVGPQKGILKADEHLGFMLSREALKNFEVRTLKLEGPGPWSVPSSARVFSQDEVNLFRVREGYIKRIDFKLHSSQESRISISSKDLSSGDEIIVHGMGPVRIAELTAFGGAPEGHSH